MAMAMMIIDIVDDDGNDVGENVTERDGTTVGLRFFKMEWLNSFSLQRCAGSCSS